MKKRAIRYLSGTFFVSTVPTLVGTQQVSAEGGNPATPEQRKEIVDYCYLEAQEYWKTHDPILALKKKFQLVKPSAETSWLDSEYRENLKGRDRTFDNKLKLDEKLYQESRSDPQKEWDCKIISGHMSSYLTSKGIKHVYASYVPGAEWHAIIIYAVNEPSKVDANKVEENWYVLDMARVLDMELTSGRYCPLKEGAFNRMWALDDKLAIKEAKDAAQIPLVDYANWKFGFRNTSMVFVVDSDSTQVLRQETFKVYDAYTLGDYLVKNSPDFALKYLIFDAAGTGEKERRLNKNGRPVPDSRRWLRELDVEPKPTFYRDFNMEVVVKGEWLSLPGYTTPYDDKLYSEWMQKNANLNNVEK